LQKNHCPLKRKNHPGHYFQEAAGKMRMKLALATMLASRCFEGQRFEAQLLALKR